LRHAAPAIAPSRTGCRGSRARGREDDRIWTAVTDGYEGKKLDAPHDVVVANDGAIWFTDPGDRILGPYAVHKAEVELPINVYRLDPQTGNATAAVDGMRRPSGLCSSPDEKKLYSVETGATEGPQSPADIDLRDLHQRRRHRSDLRQRLSTRTGPHPPGLRACLRSGSAISRRGAAGPTHDCFCMPGELQRGNPSRDGEIRA